MGPTRQRTWRFAAKRTLDLAASLVALVCLLPLLAVVAICIRCDTRGPVFFRQNRLGIGGRPFPMWKFRTLLEGSGKPSYDRLSEDDPRVTPVGRWLRPWGIDELPQLWNVVTGTMSLVGPRPELVEVVARYEPWQHRRHDVRPGLTGLWQVDGRGGRMLMHEVTEIDLEYVDSVSLRTDLHILLRTIPAVLGRKGF